MNSAYPPWPAPWWPAPWALATAGAGVAAVAAGAIWLWRRYHRLTPEQIECARRLGIHGRGRIAQGEILDLVPTPGGDGLPPLLIYQYEVSGVSYEVSQDLHLVPITFDPASWIPGLPVQVKFDPANPSNSIVACEHWVGLGVRRGAGAH